MLAVTILAVVATGILAVRASAIRSGARARNEKIATLLAQRILAELALGPPPLASATREEKFKDYPGFSYRIEVSEGSLIGVARVRRVRISIHYPIPPGPEGDTAVFVLETFFPPEGKEPKA